jgi:hypothetical protein
MRNIRPSQASSRVAINKYNTYFATFLHNFRWATSFRRLCGVRRNQVTATDIVNLYSKKEKKKERSLEEAIHWRRYQRGFQHITPSLVVFSQNFFPPTCFSSDKFNSPVVDFVAHPQVTEETWPQRLTFKMQKSELNSAVKISDFQRWWVFDRQRQFLEEFRGYLSLIEYPLCVLRYGVFTSLYVDVVTKILALRFFHEAQRPIMIPKITVR